MAELGSTNIYGDIKITGEAKKQGLSIATESYAESVANTAESNANSYTNTATSNSGNWNTAYDRSVTGVSGGGNGTLTINQQVGSESIDLSHSHGYGDLPNDVATESYVDQTIADTPFWNPDNDDRVGCIEVFATTVSPSGYLKANGAEVSRTDYQRLFDKVGTFWGAGDGSTTFNLPDVRGEFLRYWDDGRGVDSGRSFGTFQLDQMQRITGWIDNISRSGNVAPLQQGYTSEGAFGDAGSSTDTSERIGGTTSGISGRLKFGFDSSQSPDARTSSSTDGETRPRNVALVAYIKY